MKSASVSSNTYAVPGLNSDLKESTIKVKISPKKRSTKKETAVEFSPINTNPQTTNDIKNMITIKYLFHLYRTISSDCIREKIEKYKDLCKLFIITTSNENFINYKIDENNRIELLNLGYEQCKKCYEI